MRYLIYFGISISPLIINYILEKIYSKKKITTNDNYQCSTLFTTYKNYKCRNHIFNKIVCNKTCSSVYLNKIVKQIENATHSISMCMCLLTLRRIVDILIQAKNRGVNVRLISDKQMFEISKNHLLLNEGIAIKVQPKNCKNFLMHHKFCLVDEFDLAKAQLFYGSLNLTMQGVSANWEMVTFTNNEETIKSFSQEFEYLWSVFENVNIISNN